MNMECHYISNISAYPGLYSHFYKSYITTDISTRKIHNKKREKCKLYFFIKFFLFTLLIWILQCSNNWDSCRLLNYKNDKKYILILGANRSLAENNDIIKQRKEELKCSVQHVTVKTDSELKNEQREIEESINMEQGNEIHTQKEDKEVTCSEKTLEKYNNISKKYSLSFAFILSFTSLLLSIMNCIYSHDMFNLFMFCCLNLSIIIFSILLILEKIKKKKT
ncbi:fam-h protein [Plasmodium relictum]|uniref:Fam-h protein n=1 Tax=Plasmodium relictum TaxID=85471 RepID=A0A1J1GKM8_PLARL|nr:fam-h protein [Plasmodium relictum]CRG85792.1 fam-h protein [Plasmodium relictum]